MSAHVVNPPFVNQPVPILFVNKAPVVNPLAVSAHVVNQPVPFPFVNRAPVVNTLVSAPVVNLPAPVLKMLTACSLAFSLGCVVV